MRLHSARITTGNGSKLMSAPSQETLLEHELPSHPLQLVGCIIDSGGERDWKRNHVMLYVTMRSAVLL